jgi:hypothetical protein
VLVEIGGEKIENQIDFARVMIRRSVGEQLAIKVRRKSALVELSLVVGEMSQAELTS